MGNSRNMGYARHIARMKYKTRAYEYLVEKSIRKKKDHMEALTGKRRIILKYIFKR